MGRCCRREREKSGVFAFPFFVVKGVTGVESMDGMPDKVPPILRITRPPVVW
jgi:hypothetical protein